VSLRSLRLRLRGLRGRPRLDADLDEELRFHLDSLAESHRRAGLDEDEARRQARLAFGNPVALREASRELFAFARLEGLTLELRHAVRRLLRSPGFTAIALTTLALGVGANAALFAVIDAALLRPLPYPQPERLLALEEWNVAAGNESMAVSVANVADYGVPALEGVSVYATVTRDLTGRGSPVTLFGQMVDQRFFEVLGVGPAQGRAFLEEEVLSGGGKAVVIGHRLWMSRFAGDPAVLGQSAVLDGEPHRIVGVLPEGFRAPAELGRRTGFDFYVPVALPPESLTNRDDHEADVVARLREGARLEQARQQLTAVSEALARAHPDTNHNVRAHLTPLHDALAGDVRPSLLMLLGAVAAALLVACLNLSNLLLVRTLERARETAVRVALGAGPLQAVRGVLVEAVLLAAAGGALALGVAVALLRVLAVLAPANARAAEAHLDARLLGLTFALSAAVVLLSALLPARLVSHARPQDSLRAVERSLVGWPALRLSRGLLVAEMAVALVLLVGGSLLLRSLARLHGVDVGFETERVLAASINLPERRYPDQAATLRFHEELVRRLAAEPGVESAAFATRFPLRGGWTTGVEVEGSAGMRQTDAQAVSASYFATLGVPLRRGRLLSADDREGSPPVAVVNEAFARLAFPGQQAIGRRFRRRADGPWIEIVGVVGDLRRDGPDAPREPQAYLSASQTSLYPMRIADLAVRAIGDPRPLAPVLEKEVARLDPEQPVNRLLTLRDSLDAGLAARRFAALLLAAFAALAVGLALVGVYGVTSYTVSRRTAELGLRTALGASPHGLLRMLLAEAGGRIAAGIGLGLLGASALSRVLEGMLFETPRSDPAVLAATAFGLALAGLLATAVPAWRAVRVDPMTALRAE
jgi:predicted permease